MSRRGRALRWAAIAVAVPLAFLYFNNTSLLTAPLASRPFLVAHRSLGQDFERAGLTGTTCTAARMLPSEHGYLENTIPAIRAAFGYGADAVEFDIHPTTDGHFAVFHDWTLDCRTEGHGVTRDHTLAELQTLDVGYGYTSDGGRTWPFRGTGVGLMPSLTQVLTTFPQRDFIIEVKGDDPAAGALLAERLAELSEHRIGEIAVFGGVRSVAAVRERLPHVRTMTRPQLKRCGKRYIALGWTGYVPPDCANGLLFVPANLAPWLWGWPNRLLHRMDLVGTRVVLIGDWSGETFSQGFDDPDRVRELPQDYSGGIWTNRIDLLGPAVAATWSRAVEQSRTTIQPSGRTDSSGESTDVSERRCSFSRRPQGADRS